MSKKGTKRKVFEEEKEKEKEIPQPAPLKLQKGEKAAVSSTVTERDVLKKLVPTDFVFLPPTGSKNHCNIPWFVNKDDSKRVWNGLFYTFEQLRKLPFGCTRFVGKTGDTVGAYTCAVPLAENLHQEDSYHIARLQEVEGTIKDFLLSEEASDAWLQVGIAQPKTEEQLNFTPIIAEWKAKRTGQIFKEIRLKFAESFSGHVQWSCVDHRVEGKVSSAVLATVEKDDHLKGTYGFGPVYIRPTPNSKHTFVCGVSVVPNYIEIHPNPDSAIVLVD